MNDLTPIAPLAARGPSLAARAVLAIALALTFGACTTGTASEPPSSGRPSGPPPSLLPSPTTIDSPAAAAAVVLASDRRFAGLKETSPDLVGQCCFWSARPGTGGYDVTVEIGWGDCPAGCIDRHRWFYTVGTDGTLKLNREEGPPLPAGVPGPADGTTGGIGIRGIASAGPVCPVVRPNDPACADRPVAGAAIHILDATGLEVATVETDATGAFVITLPAGRYRVQADAVEGLMGTPAPAEVIVGTSQALVELQYDTGIR